MPDACSQRHQAARQGTAHSVQRTTPLSCLRQARVLVLDAVRLIDDDVAPVELAPVRFLLGQEEQSSGWGGQQPGE